MAVPLLILFGMNFSYGRGHLKIYTDLKTHKWQAKMEIKVL
jgi:hypothetical protein